MRTVAVIAGQLVVGGSERQLVLWLSHLDRTRYMPIVVTLHPDCGDPWEGAVSSLDVPLLKVPRRRNRLLRLFELTRALRAFRPDLVHGWHIFASPYAGAAARLLGGAASLGSLRGSFAAYRRHRAEALLTERLVDGIVVNSRSAALELEREGRGAVPRVFTVANGVVDGASARPEARRRLAEAWGVPTGRTWIGSVGRLEESKRFDLLLRAFAALAASRRDVHLFLVGDGRARRALANEAAALGLSGHVTFTGEVGDARKDLGAFDVFCFLSTDEGMPNVVLEAAAAEVPVVAFRAPFLEEVLEDGRSALLVPTGDLSAVQAALAALVADPALRLRLGREGRRHVLAEFGVGRFVDAMTAAYDEVLGEAPRRKEARA